MATSCAENSVVEVFQSSLDYMYSSSVDSPSTCTTKTSCSCSNSLTDPSKRGEAECSSGSSDNNQVDEEEEDEEEEEENNNNNDDDKGTLPKRCTRSSSSKISVSRSSKGPSQNCSNAYETQSSVTSSSYGGDSQLSEGTLQKALQYTAAAAEETTSGSSSEDNKGKDLISCRWFGCSKEVNFGELLDHLNSEHIRSQLKKRPGKEKPAYVCRWAGCKVYGKPSTLHSWLERHVVCHLGSKPFRCIVDHCGMRFSSQYMLNRHINGHFPKQKPAKQKKAHAPAASAVATRVQRVFDSRRKSKNQRPSTAISRDFCDSFTMSCIQRYITNFCQRTQVESNNSGQFITFRGVVVGRRTDFSGTKSCLVRWLPSNILPDEWMAEHQVPSELTQVLPLSSLPRDVIKFLMCDW